MATTRNIKWYGWHPDLPDHRDKIYAASRRSLRTVPVSVDLRPQMPPVYNQGSLGSCTANAISAAVQFCDIKEKLPNCNIMPSRLFLYYNERAIEGTIHQDSGAQIRDGIKSVNTQGLCGAQFWSYIITDILPRLKIVGFLVKRTASSLCGFPTAGYQGSLHSHLCL